MAPSAVNENGIMTNGVNGEAKGNHGFSRNRSYKDVDMMNPHEAVRFDPSLQPRKYEIKGTDPSSKVLFRDVNIIDSTGREPFKGDVYIEGMTTVPCRAVGNS